MNVIDTILSEDIVLDEEAFDRAISGFADLSIKLRNLKDELVSITEALKAGFDTPAGVKFINACEANLFQPLDDRRIVLDHISQTLRESRQAYESVFREYETLQETINSVNKN